MALIGWFLRIQGHVVTTSIVLMLMFSISMAAPVSSVNQEHENGMNIILMIGDGMGFEQVKLARWVEKGVDGQLVMESLPFNSSVTTHSADSSITDSAASATAIATGVKTDNGVISKDPDGHNLETILELAQRLDKSTGVISTCYIQHATPAAFMTHINDRNSYNTITKQIIDSANVDVLLGGGLHYFSNANITTMQDKGYSFVQNLSEMNMVSEGKLFGIFSDFHMDYELNRELTVIPSLAQMTNKSLELLSQDTDGFFLMVEGGRIDHAGHDNNKVQNALDTIAFDKAVEVALHYTVTHDDTMLIVTADHETGGLIVNSNTLDSTLPSDENTEEEKRQLRADRVDQIDVTWSSSGHTAVNVPIYGYGSIFDDMSNEVLDNTDIFQLMVSFYPQAPPLPTTTITEYTPDLVSLLPYVVAGSVLVAVVVITIAWRRRI
ncbi:MAG: alkaline phosphatase [Candidatus Lokiarchaeota archaeon]|nr:alkaline phosphatase [Candidatus Lokiarchaeota archaeon]